MELTDLIGQNITEWILLSVFLCSFLVQFFYLLYFYLRPVRLKQAPRKEDENPVTILLTVRNEEERIVKILEDILKQTYGKFEVVAVDDFSEDNTLQLLGTMSNKFPKVRLTSLGQETRFSEKISINLGLKASRYEQVLRLPASVDGLAIEALHGFNDCFSELTQAVIGYSNYKRSKQFFNRVARIERFTTFMRSSAYSLAGLPVFFSDNNVCFKKDIYFNHDGFRGNINQTHANLELVFNAHVEHAAVSLSEANIIHEDELVSRQDYVNILTKEALIRRNLSFKKRLVFFVDELSRLALLVSYVLLLFFKPSVWIVATVLFVLTNLFILVIVKKVSSRLNEPKIFLSSFMYILIKPLINICQGSIMYIKERRSKWS